MKLTDLNPEFIVSGSGSHWEYLVFDCPKCGDKPLGEHELKHSFAIPVSADHPSRWVLHIREFETLTLTPSILDIGRCKAHFFITNGEIVWS